MNGLQKTLAWLALFTGLGAAGAIAIAGVGTRFAVWDYGFALRTLWPYGVYAAMGAGAAAVLALVLAAIRRKGGGAVAAVLALLAAGGAAYFPISMQQKAAGLPLIHDISTDTANAPAFVSLKPDRERSDNGLGYTGALKLNETPAWKLAEKKSSRTIPCPGDCPTVAAAQAKAYPDLKTFASTEPFNVLFDRALKLAREQGWILAGTSADEGRIEATATTAWFGFKDDIVIRVMPDGTGSKLDMRSMSRVGLSDVGANAERIRAFLAKLKG